MSKIIFKLPNDIVMSDIASKILKNNKIEEETIDQEFEKLSNGKYSNSSTIIEAAFDIAEKNKTDDEIFYFLEKELAQPKNIIKNIINDIKKEFIPFAKNIMKEGLTNIEVSGKNNTEENAELKSILKPPIEINNILHNNEENLSLEKDKIFLESKNIEKQKKILNNIKEIKEIDEVTERPKKSKKKSDTYREPIE